MAKHPGWTAHLFSQDDLDAIGDAVTTAEASTSAELRVHLERRLPPRASDAMMRAREVFAALGMHRTTERNGVLIYLAVDSRTFAIVGDEGIHRRVDEHYWEHVRDVMAERLRAGAARDAVLAAVRDVGSVLAQYFPRTPDDRNELSDDVSVQ